MSEDLNAAPVAVITVAASGLGLALAKSCLKLNQRVVLADIDANALNHAASSLEDEAFADIIAIQCDVSSGASVKSLAAQTIDSFGRVDKLFNNAGVSGQLAPVWEQSAQDISDVLSVNLYGVIHGTKAFLPIMFKQPHRAHIINVASLYGLCSGSNVSPYAMSKSAIVAFSESLYFDLANSGKSVDVSVVCPSFANTQLFNNAKDENSLQGIMKSLLSRARPADDVADEIMKQLIEKQFYILPDKEVKDYVEQRSLAIINQTAPHHHSVEKVMSALFKRNLANQG
jgi:NAD(P)-dependent dehydrogenase (short-subunit alcohol dehydrogenase family)